METQTSQLPAPLELYQQNGPNKTLFELVPDTATPLYPGQYPRQPKKSTLIPGIISSIGVLIMAIGALIALGTTAAVLGWGLGAFGFFLSVLSMAIAMGIEEENKRRQEEDEVELNFLRDLDKTRLEQRVPIMQMARDVEVERLNGYTKVATTRMETQANITVSENQRDAAIGAAKWQAYGQAGQLDHKRDFLELDAKLRAEESALIRRHEAEEAAKVREHRSRENQLDRELTIDRLLADYRGRLAELKVRMEYESPDVQKRMAEEAYEMESRIKRLERIRVFEDDPVMFHNLMRGFGEG